jgi:succinate-semialdehyde dehydrogenase/glutarate-semialdehyde dehydrogenase
MSLQSVNPANSQILKRFESWRYSQLEIALSEAAAVTSRWSATSLAARATVLRKAASVLRAGRDELARLITLEMGKLIRSHGLRSRSAPGSVNTMPITAHRSSLMS